MLRPLEVLIVEDSPADAELIVREVRRAGFEPEWHRVDTEADYIAQLRPDQDVILSDYELPEFSGASALERLQHRGLDIPFIIVSGTIGEETAVAMMKRGAADYLLKDRLTRLGIVIDQALDQRLIRRERQHVDDAIKQGLEARVIERTCELRVAIDALEAEMTRRYRLEREILEVAEREQCRMGQDLHEGLAQELAGIALLGHALAKQLHSALHPLAATAAGIAARTSDTIDSARRLAKGFYPVELDQFGLQSALQDLASQASQRPEVSCIFHQTGKSLAIDASSQIHVYRIVQECIRNALTHGNARHIVIEAHSADRTQEISVTDDGIGFDRPTVQSGLGLHLMEYRCRMIGAEIDIRKPAEGGCRVMCRIPRPEP